MFSQIAPDDEKRRRIWQKAWPVPGRHPDVWRQDCHGNIIRFGDYGNRQSAWGWEYDRVTPAAVGGSDQEPDMRPLHCSKNASLGGILGATLADYTPPAPRRWR